MTPLLRFRSLNVHATWPEVLGAVGSPAASRALPASARCPFCCGARLSIYDDTISGGAWHYCFDCGKSGDMLELAASAWGVSFGVAARRLSASCGFPSDRLTEEHALYYARDFADRRKTVNDLWDKSKAYFPRCDSDVFRRLVARFRLQGNMPPARWAEGPGNMLGAYHRIGVEKALNPGSVLDSTRIVYGAKRKAFWGRGWTDVLVVPHHDLPGRICGFSFAGRDGDAKDRVYARAVHRTAGRNQEIAEGGLACRWAVENSHGMFGNKVVACGDPMLALRLQIRHFAASATPLPLVAYCDTASARTKNAWRSLGAKTPVLWGWALTPALLHQAMLCDGEIAVTALKNPNGAGVDHFVRDAEPRTIVRRAAEKGKPWRDYVSAWAEDAADGEIEKLLMGMEAYGDDRRALASLHPRIKALAAIPDAPRRAGKGRRSIVERDGCWWTDTDDKSVRESRLVMNAMLRIDGTSAHKAVLGDTVMAKYKGRLIHGGDTIPFEHSMQSLSDNCPVVLSRILACNKPGATLFVAPGWKAGLVRAAIQFSQAA